MRRGERGLSPAQISSQSRIGLRAKDANLASFEDSARSSAKNADPSSARHQWSLAKGRVVSSIPDGREFDRLVTIRNQHADRMAGLIEQLWAIPAKTKAGRQAKANVVLA